MRVGLYRLYIGILTSSKMAAAGQIPVDCNREVSELSRAVNKLSSKKVTERKVAFS